MALSPDVDFLMDDPDLGAHSFTIIRRTGEWRGGRLIIHPGEENTTYIDAVGLIVPPSSDQLEFFPEGVRREATKAIYSRTIMHVTEGKDVSDTITWEGDLYKIVRADPWNEWGFCVAYAVKE